MSIRRKLYKVYDTQKVYRSGTRKQAVKKDTIEYETYHSKFGSSMTVSVGLKMAEFETQKDPTIKYEFQVDETTNPKKQTYDVIIGNNLL